jgi:hypothetical protein
VTCRRFVFPALAAGLLAGPPAVAPARAQTAAVESPPVPPGWVVTPALAVAALWDNNVALTGRDGDVLSDSLIALTPGVEAGFRGRRATAGLGYRGRFDFYRHLSVFDAVTHTAHLDATHRATRRLSLFVRDALTIAPTTEGFDAAGLVLRRRTTTMNDARAGVEWTLRPRTSAVMAYSNQVVSFAKDELVAPLLRGGQAHLVDLGLRHTVHPRVTVGARYDIQRAVITDDVDHFVIQHAFGVAEYAPTRTLGLSIEAGYAWQVAGVDGGSQSAPAFRAGLALKRPKVSWDLSYRRSFMPAFGFGGTVQNAEVQAALRLTTGRRVAWTSGVSLRENEPLMGDQPTLRTLAGHTTLSLTPASPIRVELYGTLAMQDAQRPGGRVDRTLAGIRVTALHTTRMR